MIIGRSNSFTGSPTDAEVQEAFDAKRLSTQPSTKRVGAVHQLEVARGIVCSRLCVVTRFGFAVLHDCYVM